MKLILQTLVWILILGLTSCQNDKNAKQSADRLVSTNWIFLGLQHPDTRMFGSIPSDISGMNIIFYRSGNFQANSSCNIVYGYYSIAGKNSMKMDSITMTKMFCMDSIQIVWEDKYVSGLKNSKEFEISQDTLSIKTNINTELIFKAASR